MYTRKEIGGEFASVEFQKRDVEYSPMRGVFPDDALFYLSGRIALQALIDSQADLPKHVILPAHCCHSVSMPFARAGFSLRFYDSRRDLSPDLDQIWRITRHSTAVFIHMGYFGHRTNAGLSDILGDLGKQGFFILEDTTQTILNENPSVCASHCSFASVRKWLGISQGGALLPGKGMKHPPLPAAPHDAYSRLRCEAMRLKADYESAPSTAYKARYLELYRRAEDMLDSILLTHGIDRDSQNSLMRADVASIRLARRENYAALLRSFPIADCIRPVFSSLGAGDCPLYFPVYCNDNRKMQKALAKLGLYCPIHWPSDTVDAALLPGHAYIVKHILAIPCDQRYSTEDMRLANEILSRCLASSA